MIKKKQEEVHGYPKKIDFCLPSITSYLIEKSETDIEEKLTRLKEGKLDLFLVPFCSNDHWILYVVDKYGVISIFDSLAGKETVPSFSKYVKNILGEMKIVRVIKNNHQNDNFSCGTWICLYAEYLSMGWSFNDIGRLSLTKKEIKEKRSRILTEVASWIPYHSATQLKVRSKQLNTEEKNRGDSMDR